MVVGWLVSMVGAATVAAHTRIPFAVAEAEADAEAMAGGWEIFSSLEFLSHSLSHDTTHTYTDERHGSIHVESERAQNEDEMIPCVVVLDSILLNIHGIV